MSKYGSEFEWLRRLLPVAAAALASGGCSDTTVPSTTGIVEVVTTTSGDPGAAEYRVELDTLLAEAIAPTDNRRLTQVAPGDHVVILRSVPLHCVVTSANPQYVTVEAGETSTAAFAVGCDPTPTAPPDLVFELDASESEEPQRRTEFYAIQIDGKGLRKLTSNGFESGPQWTTDGSRIDFRSETGGPDGTPALFSMLPDGSDRRMTKSGLRGDLQTWSHDRTRLLFRWVQPGLDDQLAHLYVTDSAETALARVHQPEGPSNPFITSPSWSPDDQLVAFDVQGRIFAGGGSPGSYIAQPGVADAMLVAHGGQPGWSPDGQRLAFVDGPREPHSNLWILTLSAEFPVQVTHAAMDTLEWRYLNPAWSPDGQWLAVGRTPPFSYPDPSRELVVMRPDGSDIRILRRFTASPFDDVLPAVGRIAWRPNGGVPQ